MFGITVLHFHWNIDLATEASNEDGTSAERLEMSLRSKWNTDWRCSDPYPLNSDSFYVLYMSMYNSQHENQSFGQRSKVHPGRHRWLQTVANGYISVAFLDNREHFPIYLFLNQSFCDSPCFAEGPWCCRFSRLRSFPKPLIQFSASRTLAEYDSSHCKTCW